MVQLGAMIGGGISTAYDTTPRQQGIQQALERRFGNNTNPNVFPQSSAESNSLFGDVFRRTC